MPGAVFLEGEEVRLRTVEEEDLERIRDVLNRPEVWRHMSHNRPQNLEQEREFFENVVCGDEKVNLAICVENELLGLVGLQEREEGVAEIGIWLAPEEHGKGYGTEASELLIGYGFDELRYHRIVARAFESNKASQRVWEKLGFEKEGELRDEIYRNGEFEDVYFYGILENEWG